MKKTLTGIIRAEDDIYVALNPELDIASQGATTQHALSNLQEAVDLFLETASKEEIEERLRSESLVTQFVAEYAPA
jgi:predicted RNase H-like HicB family nuclease